ncbi:GPI mannosyltransferase 3 [Dictyocoela muelleri]|nr:GPI mannosyltransferase 3 [Dictyocoela muelleri]
MTIHEIISNDKNLFIVIFLLRIINSFLTITIFEPDEFYQCTEIVQFLATGKGELTWDWHFGIRSITFPLIYTIPSLIFYWIFYFLKFPYLEFTSISFFIIRFINALFASVCDLTTIKIYDMFYKDRHNIVLTTFFSHGLWLYSTRSHVNTIEMVICMIILYFSMKYKKSKNVKITVFIAILSTFVIYLRVTAILLILIPLLNFFFSSIKKANSNKVCNKAFKKVCNKDRNKACNKASNKSKTSLKIEPDDLNSVSKTISVQYLGKKRIRKRYKNKRNIKVRKSQYFKSFFNMKFTNLKIANFLLKKENLRHLSFFILTGIFMTGVLIFIDSIFYQELTIPPLNFIKINIFYGISNLFGKQHFLSHLFFIIILIGMPIITINRKISMCHLIIILYICFYSCVGHKEMRFLVPLIPLMNIITSNRKTNFQIFFVIIQFVLAIIANLFHQNYQIMIFLKQIIKPGEKIFFGVCPYSLPQYSILKNESKMLTGNPEIFKFLDKDMIMKRFKETNLRINEYHKFMNDPYEGIKEYLDWDYLVLGEEIYFKLIDILENYELVNKIKYCLFKFEREKDVFNYILKKVR